MLDTPIRVLVVDDDDAIRLLVTRLFLRNGYAVESAADGAEAIEKMAQSQFDLIVLDLMMPRLDGIGVIERLASAERDRGTRMPRILVMTAAAPSIVKMLPTQHIARVITKPFDLAALLREAVEALGSGENEVPAAVSSSH
jgi:two-component system response regulator MprA